MIRDLSRPYRLDQLAKDGAACATLCDRLLALLCDINFEAAQAHDGATADALKELANDLADAAHGPVSALAVAHDKACDDEGAEPFWTIGADLAVAIGVRVDAPLPAMAAE